MEIRSDFFVSPKVVLVFLIFFLTLFFSGCAKVPPKSLPVPPSVDTPGDSRLEKVTVPRKGIPPFLERYNRGVTLLDGALRLRKPLKEAEKEFEASLALKPGFFSALYNIAYVAFRDARYDDALRNIEAALSYRRTKEAELLKASILKNVERDLAVKQYLRIAQKYGDASFAFGEVGSVLMEQGKYREAVTYFEKSGRLEKERYQIFVNKGTCYVNMASYAKAKEAYEAVYSLGVRGRYLLAQYAFTLRKTGGIKNAVKVYEELIELFPDETAAYKNIGVAYDLYLDRPEKAVKYYSKYIEFGGIDRVSVENWRQIAMDKSKKWFK